jgi:hypothetical protein
MLQARLVHTARQHAEEDVAENMQREVQYALSVAWLARVQETKPLRRVGLRLQQSTQAARGAH